MNWSLFFSTFVMIFVAELGDKTQLAIMNQSAVNQARWVIFLAGGLALIASTALGVMAGGVLHRLVPDERWLKGAGGILFLFFGVMMLIDVFKRAS